MGRIGIEIWNQGENEKDAGTKAKIVLVWEKRS